MIRNSWVRWCPPWSTCCHNGRHPFSPTRHDPRKLKSIRRCHWCQIFFSVHNFSWNSTTQSHYYSKKKQIMKTHTPDQLHNFISTVYRKFGLHSEFLSKLWYLPVFFKLRNKENTDTYKSLALKVLVFFCDDSQGQKKKKGSHPYLLSSDWHTKSRIEK